MVAETFYLLTAAWSAVLNPGSLWCCQRHLVVSTRMALDYRALLVPGLGKDSKHSDPCAHGVRPSWLPVLKELPSLGGFEC